MLDIRDFTFGIQEIDQFVLINEKVPENELIQKRVYQKWINQKNNLANLKMKSAHEIKSYQLKLIAQLVDHAYSTNPFYNKLYNSVGYTRGDLVTWNDYYELPVISKNDLINNKEWLAGNIAPQLSECYRYTTSGSSGQVLTLYQDSVMNDAKRINYLRFYDEIMHGQLSKDDWIYEVYLSAPTVTSLQGRYPIFTVSHECPVTIVLEHLKKLKPKILSGFPSYLLRLARQIKNYREFDFIKGIITNSEPSTNTEREFIGSQMGRSKVYDEYSSVEFSMIATQCCSGHYHLWEDNVRVDIINQSRTGLGDIIATNLNNSFTPIIKYKIGDVASIRKNGRCKCKSNYRVLNDFVGRNDQLLESRTVGIIPPHLVMGAYDKTILTDNSNIKEFMILQEEISKLKLLLVLIDYRKEIEDIAENFCNELRKIFKDDRLTIEIEVLDQLPNLGSHKRRIIINKM